METLQSVWNAVVSDTDMHSTAATARACFWRWAADVKLLLLLLLLYCAVPNITHSVSHTVEYLCCLLSPPTSSSAHPGPNHCRCSVCLIAFISQQSCVSARNSLCFHHTGVKRKKTLNSNDLIWCWKWPAGQNTHRVFDGETCRHLLHLHCQVLQMTHQSAATHLLHSPWRRTESSKWVIQMNGKHYVTLVWNILPCVCLSLFGLN